MSLDASDPDLLLWQDVCADQSKLFTKVLKKNKELEERVKALEEDVQDWKNRYKQEKVKTLDAIEKLNVETKGSQTGDPLCVCLIDGDGAIFSPELLVKGRDGGREAAAKISQHLTGFMSAEYGHSVQLLVAIYFNKQGLSQILEDCQICTPQNLSEFVLGMNLASPLFVMCDVGPGKEAADAKLRDFLQLYTRLPQVVRCYFAGSHDASYASVLSSLQTAGLLSKINLVKSYDDVPRELMAMNLPSVELGDLFMRQKLVRGKPFGHQSHQLAGGSIQQQQNGSPSSPFKNAPTSPSKSNKKKDGVNTKPTRLPFREVDPTKPLNKQNPPPCNFHYLSASCQQGVACPYAHDYDLSPDMIAQLRADARKTPCPTVYKGKKCRDTNCHRGHSCPNGPNCKFGPKCKFFGPNGHVTGLVYDSEHSRGETEDEARMISPKRAPGNRGGNVFRVNTVKLLSYGPASPSTPLVEPESQTPQIPISDFDDFVLGASSSTSTSTSSAIPMDDDNAPTRSSASPKKSKTASRLLKEGPSVNRGTLGIGSAKIPGRTGVDKHAKGKGRASNSDLGDHADGERPSSLFGSDHVFDRGQFTFKADPSSFRAFSPAPSTPSSPTKPSKDKIRERDVARAGVSVLGMGGGASYTRDDRVEDEDWVPKIQCIMSVDDGDDEDDMPKLVHYKDVEDGDGFIYSPNRFMASDEGDDDDDDDDEEDMDIEDSDSSL